MSLSDPPVSVAVPRPARAALPVEISRLSKSYGAVRALDDIDLVLRAGRVPHPARTVGLRQDDAC